MHSFILIDMSTSMQPRWPETIDAVNGFVKAVAVEDPDRRVTVYGFALPHVGPLTALTALRAASTAVGFIPLGDTTPKPNGMTPLFDAIRLLAKAMAGTEDRRSITVITDGEENASAQTTAEQAKTIIAAWKAYEWDVTFLGADFNAFGQAAALGLGAKDVLNAKAGNYAHATIANAMRSMAYAGGQSVHDLSFSDDDRKAADGGL